MIKMGVEFMEMNFGLAYYFEVCYIQSKERVQIKWKIQRKVKLL